MACLILDQYTNLDAFAGASEPPQYGHVRATADSCAAGGGAAAGDDASGRWTGPATDASRTSRTAYASIPKSEFAVLRDAVSTVSLDAKSVW